MSVPKSANRVSSSLNLKMIDGEIKLSKQECFSKSKSYSEIKEIINECVKIDLEKYVVLLNPITIERKLKINVHFSCEIYTSAFSNNSLDGSTGKAKIIQPKGCDISPFLSFDTCFGNVGIHTEDDACKVLPEIKRIIVKKKNLEKKILNKAYNKCKKFGYTKEEVLDVIFDLVDKKDDNKS